MKYLFILVMIFMCLFVSYSWADSPVGNLELYKYGFGNPLIKEAYEKGVLDEEMLSFLDDEQAMLNEKILLLNAVVQKYPTILNTAILAKYWGTTYRDVFRGMDNLSEWKRFLLSVSALFQEALSPDSHLKVLETLKGDLVNKPQYKAVVAIAKAQLEVVENKEQCEVFSSLKAIIEKIDQEQDLGILGRAMLSEIVDYMQYCQDSAFLKTLDKVGIFVNHTLGIKNAYADENLQPRWVNGEAIDIEKIKTELNESVDMSVSGGSLELTCGEPNNKVPVKTCTEYYNLLDKGCYAYSTYDMTMQGWFIFFCDPRKSFLSALPSKKSYLGELLEMPVDDVIQRFALVDYFSFSKDEEAAFNIAKKKGLHWWDLFYDLETEKTENGFFKMQSRVQGFVLFLDIVGFGDINADGIEDVNVNTAMQFLGGTLRTYNNVWFTSKSNRGMLKRISLEGR